MKLVLHEEDDALYLQLEASAIVESDVSQIQMGVLNILIPMTVGDGKRQILDLELKLYE
jgi:hypothetical protein